MAVLALQASYKDPRTLKAKYRVTVVTSQLSGAGTDANVFVQLFGDEGETSRINLDNPGRQEWGYPFRGLAPFLPDLMRCCLICNSI